MSKRTSKSKRKKIRQGDAFQDVYAEREASKYEKPIPSREFILEHLKRRGRPASHSDLIQELEIRDPELDFALSRRLKAMVRESQIERLHGGLFWPAGQRQLVTGRIQIEKGKKNKVWVIPDDGSARITLYLRDSAGIYHGNKVVVSVLTLEDVGICEAHLVEVLEQQAIRVTGRFAKGPGFNYVIPHSKDIAQDILIPQNQDLGAKDGDIVVVEITTPPPHWDEPLGNITEILGHEDNAGIEILAATKAYGLPDCWSEMVAEEIQLFTETVPETAKKHRLDLRDLPLVTIDGEDAKDFDDAVYCEPKPKGGWRLFVAIADVSFYVRPGTALDEEARLRGNSVYFPGKVIPMLPEVLSNGLCSLKPEVDRLCIVCIMNIDPEGKLGRYEFHEAVMHSKARLTYTKVAHMLTIKNDSVAEQYKEVLPQLEELDRLYRALRKARETRGAIEFETSETRIIFGTNGKINRIEPVFRNDAHRIIEECMLCANVATAKFLKKHKLPGLYRVHEGPPIDKLTDLKVFLKELGLALSGGAEPTPLDYAKLLAKVQGRKDANIIQSVLLRSLSQAVYSPDNLGHFGLAYPAYAHFTSPIRRYPDLLVHRQIRLVLQGHWVEKAKALAGTEEAEEALKNLAEHTSMTERRADDATRDVVRWLKCEYIQKHIGDVFEGIISGVTRFGFFVELKNIYIDGLVHVANLHNDYYYFDNIRHRLIGERSGKIFRLGDGVRVRVAKVDIAERKIDFELIVSREERQEQAKETETRKGKARRGLQDARGKPDKKSNRKEHKSSKKKEYKKKNNNVSSRGLTATSSRGLTATSSRGLTATSSRGLTATSSRSRGLTAGSTAGSSSNQPSARTETTKAKPKNQTKPKPANRGKRTKKPAQ